MSDSDNNPTNPTLSRKQLKAIPLILSARNLAEGARRSLTTAITEATEVLMALLKAKIRHMNRFEFEKIAGLQSERTLSLFTGSREG